MLLRGVVARILEVEDINYSVSRKYDPATDAVDDANGMSVPIDFEALQREFNQQVTDVVAADAETWQFKDALTADEYNKLKKINTLIARRLSGKSIAISVLRNVLSDEEYADYQTSIATHKTMAEAIYADGVPDELKRYNIMLREADFQLGKYEMMSGLRDTGRAKYRTESLKRTYDKSEDLYERTLEYLQEQMEVSVRDKSSIDWKLWLDRDVDFSTDGNLGINADQVPRVKGSRSHYAQDAELPKLSVLLKREQCGLENLIRAAVACAYVPQEVVEQAKPKFNRALLSLLNPEKD